MLNKKFLLTKKSGRTDKNSGIEAYREKTGIRALKEVEKDIEKHH